MRLFVSAFLLLAATAGFGQNQAQPVPSPAKDGAVIQTLGNLIGSGNQAGCPVVLTSARLNWPASYLPVTSAEKVTEPNLALGFAISSVQPVRSIVIKARLLVKNNLYQLDANAFDLRLTISGAYAADNAAEQLRELRLPADLHAYGVTRVSLDRVLFTNGDVWSAWPSSRCSLDVQGSAERVAK